MASAPPTLLAPAADPGARSWPRATIAAALALSGAIVAPVALAGADPAIAGDLLVLPVVLLALVAGPRGGLAGAAGALGLLGLLHAGLGASLPPVAYATHAAAYAVLGALVGLLAQRARRAPTRLEEPRREAQVRSALDLRSIELARTNAHLAHFASVAAHDLSEPVRAVTGFAELLRRRAEADLDPRAREHLAAIERAGERMAAMLDGLRAYGAVGRDDSTEERVELDALLDRVAAGVAPVLLARGGRLERSPLPAVAGHPGQLEQVLHNLVGNAIKYADGAPPDVAVGATRHGAAWRVTVTDNGTGVPERHRDRIFEIFRRAPGHAGVPGTGVGLAVCRRIVRAHGGDIWVDPAPGGGSAFSFTLPDPEVRP